MKAVAYENTGRWPVNRCGCGQEACSQCHLCVACACHCHHRFQLRFRFEHAGGRLSFQPLYPLPSHLSANAIDFLTIFHIIYQRCDGTTMERLTYCQCLFVTDLSFQESLHYFSSHKWLNCSPPLFTVFSPKWFLLLNYKLDTKFVTKSQMG